MNPQRLGSQIQNSVILSLLCILQNPLQAKHCRDQADELQARHLCQLSNCCDSVFVHAAPRRSIVLSFV